MKPARWLREPLLHFLLAGFALFLLVSWLDPAPETGREILIDDDTLVARLQQRTGGDAETLAEALRVMPEEERAALVREAAAEEALYREGRALGIDRVDGVVRLRTIQQMRLLLAEEVNAGLSVSDEEVATYFVENGASYAEPATISFRHLFYAGADGEARARTALAEGRTDTGASDRFLYHSTYADSGAEQVASQFGIGFLDGLMRLEPGSEWQGPLESDHGWHLVQLSEKAAARVPALEEVEARVREDALAAKRSEALEREVDRLLERYEVKH